MPADAPSLARRIGRWIAGLGLLFIVAMTLIPEPEAIPLVTRTSIYCLVCGEMGTVDVILNVILFVPFGLGLRLAGWSWRRAILATALTTLAIELLQMKVVAGRDASVSDLLTNTLGGAAGAALGTYWRSLLEPTKTQARRLLWIGGAVWLLIVGASTILQLRSLPTGSDYFGQWAPSLPGFEQYRGRILTTHAGGLPVPNGRLRSTPLLRDRLGMDSVRVGVSTVSPGRSGALAPVFAVFDERQREVFMVLQNHGEAQFRIRTLAQDVRLRPITIRRDDIFGSHAGDTVDIVGTVDRGHIRIYSRRGGHGRSFALNHGPNLGWAMLMPYPYALGEEAKLLTAIWIATLLAPLGFWTGAVARPARATAGLAAMVVVGFLAVPWLCGFPAVRWWEWASAALGLAAGWSLSWIRFPSAAGAHKLKT